MTTEFKVGMVVLLGIIILFYMSFRVGKFGSLTEGPGYEVVAHFKNVAGLDTKSPVEIAGVEVGRVNKVSLDGTMAKTTLLMKEDTKTPITGGSPSSPSASWVTSTWRSHRVNLRSWQRTATS